MSTRTVSFKAPEAMIDALDNAVEAGNYTSRGELLRDLLRNVEFRKLSDQARSDIEAGRSDSTITFDEL